MEKRIIDIETLLAHHEEQINEMSDMISSQWKQIDLLKKQMLHLSDKLKQTQNDALDDNRLLSSLEQAAQDKPPHY